MNTAHSNVLKTELYGDFDESLPPSQEYVRIQFSPGSIPLKQRWRNNGLSANFMADFLITFFPHEKDDGIEGRNADLQGVICYIANELLENAMKFTSDTTQRPISITLYLLSDRLVFVSTNSISHRTKERLQTFIHSLAHSSPNQLYTEQLETSVSAPEGSSAGLGILIMINDYLAKIGWKIEADLTHTDHAIVTTMVQLTL